MKRSELFAQARFDLDDEVQPYQVTPERMLGFFNEAIEQAARRARLIRDATTPDVARLALNTSSQGYALHPAVLFVRRLALDSRSLPLDKKSWRNFDESEPGWLGRTGTPDKYCLDYETGKVWFNRKPTAADVARLLVVRLPLKPLSLETGQDSEPEIPRAGHAHLVHWVLYRAYSQRDTDLYNEKLAVKHLTLFTNQFGEESSVLEEEWAREHYGQDPFEGEL